MRDKIFFTICFGFLFGVLTRSFLFVNVFLALCIGLVGFALFLFFKFVSKSKRGILASLFVLVFCLGVVRFHLSDKPAPEIFESKVGQTVALSGEIIDEPSISGKSERLTVEAVLGGRKTRILLSAHLGGNYRYGDRVNFSGHLEKIENFVTDQGKEFDYINYLRKDGVFYSMHFPEIEVVSRGGNILKHQLFSFKESFLRKMNLAIRSPESLLMGGLILGERSSFSDAMRQSFVNTGTIHIVALSGYNVTIVADWIRKLLSFLPKNFGFGAGILGIFLFVIMSGGSSTAMRAGIMASLALFARATGRNYDVARALVLAAVAMVLINPLTLAFDVSFQLSFISTVAIIFFAPRIEKYFLWMPERFGLREVATLTSAAYIFVFPFILYKIGNLSLVALPANILILPFIPLTMFLGFLTGFFGLVSYLLAMPLGFVSYLFLHYELGVIAFFSSLPFSSFTISNFPFILALLIYAYFVYMLFGRNIKEFFLARP